MTQDTNNRAAPPLQLERGTARPVEPGITRRALLLASPAVVAIAAAPTLARGAQASGTPSIKDLIKAHRSAFEHLERAVELVDEAEYAFRKRENPRVGISINAEGKSPSGYYELGPLSAAEIRQHIITSHRRLRELHCGAWATSMVPDFAAAVEQQIDAAEQRSLANLDSVVAQQEAGRAASGLIEARDEVSRATREERRSMAMLLAKRPVDAAEQAAKSAYIEAHEAVIGESVIDDDGMLPVLLSMLNGVVS